MCVCYHYGFYDWMGIFIEYDYIVLYSDFGNINYYDIRIHNDWRLIQGPLFIYSLVGWGCRIQRLYLCRGVKLATKECPVYDIKLSDGKAPALEIWEMWSTPSLLLFPGPLWPGIVAPDRVLSMSQIKQFDI